MRGRPHVSREELRVAAEAARGDDHRPGPDRRPPAAPIDDRGRHQPVPIDGDRLERRLGPDASTARLDGGDQTRGELGRVDLGTGLTVARDRRMCA